MATIQTFKGLIDTDWLKDVEYRRALSIGIKHMVIKGELDRLFTTAKATTTTEK